MFNAVRSRFKRPDTELVEVQYLRRSMFNACGVQCSMLRVQSLMLSALLFKCSLVQLFVCSFVQMFA